jgi:hypothetical protein
MKRVFMGVWITLMISGCLNQPVGFRLNEPGGYNYTTGNLRDHYNYERYGNGKVAVRLTLRMVELGGEVYDPQFDVSAFLDRIGWSEAILESEPEETLVDGLPIIRFDLRDEAGQALAVWVLNLNTPYDVWVEVRGDPEEIDQAFSDWEEAWASLEYLIF